MTRFGIEMALTRYVNEHDINIAEVLLLIFLMDEGGKIRFMERIAGKDENVLGNCENIFC